MKEDDLKFLHGKGHICNYCDFSKDSWTCRSIEHIKNYAQIERGIYVISIQIFDCSIFKRKKDK